MECPDQSVRWKIQFPRILKDCRFDSHPTFTEILPMPTDQATAPRLVTVRAVPIELCQFLKFGGLTDSGGAAKQAVAERRVTVNDALETQKSKKLLAGDRVTLGGQTITVHVA
jgi:ribosome-associated protein